MIYPPHCLACTAELVEGEEFLCNACLLELPLSHFHQHPNNPVFRRFVGRVRLERAAAWLAFNQGGLVQKLMHQFKYRDQPRLALWLAQQAAQEWQASAFFEDIDLIIPVPLHPRKRKKRGYNQAEQIALGLSRILLIPCDFNSLRRSEYKRSQTREHRFERWQQVSRSFSFERSASFKGNHILLVDDVVTTGATLEACAQVLHRSGSLKVSVFCLAHA